MNTFLMWLGGLLIAIFALLFAGPYFVDWNSYRGVFEEEATRVLGRRVRVGGSVNVRLLPAPYLLFEDLRIADTTGIAGAPLFRTQSFKMWLAVPPLLKGAFEANKIELERPVLALAGDASGFGNWRSLLEAKSLPFVPTGVKLDSVLIEDGAISYSIEGGGELARVEKISGELTAQALAGPYSFRGTATVGGNASDVRLATTEAGADGSFRINAHVSGGETASDHKFDGLVQGLWDLPGVAGQLVSKVRVADALATGGKPLIAEARADVTAKGQLLDLTGLTVSFNDFAQPQIVTGSMTALWSSRHTVDLDLSSRWLDVDLMLGSLEGSAGQAASADGSHAGAENGGGKGATAAPLPTARALITRLLDVFPGNTDVKARLRVDQVKLGGDRVAGLVVAMERAGGPLQLKTLRALLPGGARLNFSGKVEAMDGEPVFDGDLFIGGVSAAKIIRWAVGSDDAKSLISDGPFSVGGRMQLGSNQVILTSAVAEFSGVPIRGGLTWDDERRAVDLTVEGYEIDTRWFGLGKLEMPALAVVLAAKSGHLAGETAALQSAEGGLAGWFDAQQLDLNLDLSAGRLTDGTTTLTDVEAQIKLSGRRIDIARLKLVTEEGLSADVSGSLDGLGKSPKGAIDYLVGAEDRAAAWKLADLWAGDAAAPSDRDRFAAFAPIRVAGRADLGTRLPTAADFSFDGRAGGGRISGRLSLDGGIASWRGAPVDFVVHSQAADTGQLIASLAGDRSVPDSGSKGGDTGSLLVKAVGVPEKSLLTLMTLDSSGISMVFDGSSTFSGNGISTMSGELQLRDGDIRRMLRLAGLNAPGGVGKISYDGLADVAWSPGQFAITPRDVNFNGARVGGRLVVTIAEEARRKIEGRLVADSASLPKILAALLSEPGPQPETVQVAHAEAAGGEAAGAGALSDGGSAEIAPQIFSDRAFDLSLLEGIEGSIDLNTGRLDIGADMAVTDARTTFRASGNKLTLEFGGRPVIGGDLKASLDISKAAAGALISGTLEVADANIATLPLAAAAAARGGGFGSGRAGVKLDFEGRGLSPRGMISVMTGKGQLQLRDVTLRGLTAEGIRAAAEETLQAETFSTDDLVSRLSTGMAGGRLAIGAPNVALDIADGAVQIAAVDAEQEGGRTRIVTTLDLRAFVFDSERRIVADDPVLGRPWPPVIVNTVGALQKLGALEPRITADSLERELAVRKMERNVNELERLRQLDEEAAARQRERERQLELESQRIEAERAAAAAAAAGGANGAVPGAVPPAGALPDGWAPKQQNVPGEGQATPAAAPPGEPNTAGTAASPGASERPVPQSKRKPRKPKPDPNSLTKQIFGF